MAKAAQTGVRLMPAVMATAAVLLTLKAVGMAEVVAETVEEGANPSTAHPAAATPPPSAGQAQCEPASLAEMTGLSQSEVAVLQALSERRAALDQRAAQFETQDELMLAAERRLNERLTELRRLEAHVNQLLGNLDEAQEQRIAGLVDVYQRMRAKDAATVFDGLEDDVMVQVASRMRQANLAEVMGRMDPERARRLTQMLADRAQPPSGGDDLLTRARGESASGG